MEEKFVEIDSVHPRLIGTIGLPAIPTILDGYWMELSGLKIFMEIHPEVDKRTGRAKGT